MVENLLGSAGDPSVVSKSPTITEEWYILPFHYVSFCFMYSKALIVCAHVFITAITGFEP